PLATTSHQSPQPRKPKARGPDRAHMGAVRPRTTASGLICVNTHGDWGAFELESFLLRAAGSSQEEEREGDADPGEDGDREEGRLEALGQCDQPARAGVGGEVVVGAGDGYAGDDRDAERRSDLEARVAEPGGDPRFVLGHAGKRGDRGGDEGEADTGSEHEQPEEDV